MHVFIYHGLRVRIILLIYFTMNRISDAYSVRVINKDNTALFHSNSRDSESMDFRNLHTDF